MTNELYVENTDDLSTKVINNGQNGKCFLTKDNMVFKYIENPDEINLKRLSKFYSTHFVFPRTLVYSKDGKLLGYIMEYIDGNPLYKLPEFVSFEKYKSEIERIEREIEVLTCYRIRMFDMSPYNMLYSDTKGIRIIDTDYYGLNDNNKTLYLYNMSKFSYSSMYPIMDIYETNFKNDNLNKYNNLAKKGRMKPSDYIYELEKECNKNSIEEINTIKDFSKQLKLI